MGPPLQIVRRRIYSVLFVLSVLASGCRSQEAEEIELILGPEQVVRFQPRAAFAEYFELSGVSDQLRITLASYEADCRKLVPPPPHGVSITITVESPLGRPLGVGEYPYTAEEPRLDQPRALPFIRLHEGAERLPAYGKLKLTGFEPDLHGLVRGELEFLNPEEGRGAALSGKFTVRLCRSVLDATRNKED
jgi:hypothetical protein